MEPEPKGRRQWSGWVFPLAAGAFALGALFHVFRLIHPVAGDGSPPWRHAVFVGVNLALGAAFLRRPRWFPPVFAVLVCQQLVSHGVAAWVAARRGMVDVASILVLLGLPTLLVLLSLDAKKR